MKTSNELKALFESILNNHIILFETKVNAKRHFTNEEAKEIVETVKQSIDDGTFDIVDRKKNRDYLKAEKLTKKDCRTNRKNVFTTKLFTCCFSR